MQDTLNALITKATTDLAALAVRPDFEAAKARLVSFRDEDGRFRQRLFAADGTELLLSEAFDDPKLLNQVSRGLAGADLPMFPVDAQGYVVLGSSEHCWARVPADQLANVRAALRQI